MRYASIATAILGLAAAALGQPAEPAMEQVLARLGDYVRDYGEQASVVVATEKYTQSVLLTDTDVPPSRPRQIEAEFAIVRVTGGGWTGFRDVVAVDGKPVHDRRDRLAELLTNAAGDASEAIRIANESARFNIGPISRNFNVPTAALFFFKAEEHARFAFERKGKREIEGVAAWEIAFKETRRPTLIMTRSGQDVPLEGALWVNPLDGTVVRTRIRMKNFADQLTSPEQKAPEIIIAPEDPSVTRGAIQRAGPGISLARIDTAADIEVTYRRPAGMNLWLPATMVELYEGPIRIKVTPVVGRATTRASYSNFKQFNTSIKIVQE